MLMREHPFLRVPTTCGLLLFCLAATAVMADAPAQDPAGPAADQEEVCVLETSLGTMVFRFFADGAPKTVAHFKKLVTEGLYDGKPFYRVVQGHVIQTGVGSGSKGPKVVGEFGAHLHEVGTVGLARDADPDSGSTEFYICLAPRPHLDGGYATFGQLIEGYDVLERIGAVEVEESWIGKVAFHRPKTPVVIERAYLETRPIADAQPPDP